MVEGMRPSIQPKFMTIKQFKKEKTLKQNWDAISTGYTLEQINEKFDSI
jgi:hypothetical protein